jgi:alkylation response protein AidB-like acyl-CoA dehydrogenase
VDFEISHDQAMLRDTLARYLSERYSFAARRDTISSPSGSRQECWKAFARELGILGASFAESEGGIGGGPIETMIIMEELGRRLVVEPYLSTVVIGGGFLKYGAGDICRGMIRRIVDGDMLLAFAHTESSSEADPPAMVSTQARRHAGGFVLSGVKTVVRDAPGASYFIVTARTGGGLGDADGVAVFVVDRTAPGIVARNFLTYDGKRASQVEFRGVELPHNALISVDGEGLALIERVLDEAIAALCAEAVGVQRQLLDETVSYSKQRRQFDRALAEFQVLRHRMADMLMHVELSAAATAMATMQLNLSASERGRAASAAKIQINRACRYTGQSAIQIHGGIGLADESAVAHYFKRATMIEGELGTSNYHLARYHGLSTDQKSNDEY